jgi:hypothetical protein
MAILPIGPGKENMQLGIPVYMICIDEAVKILITCTMQNLRIQETNLCGNESEIKSAINE